MHALDPTHLINSYGFWGIFAIIFAESGLFFGFFLPGDSLLVTAGLLASTHKAGDVHLNLALLLVGCAVAAIVGDQVGYAFGRHFGPKLFARPESRLFKQEHLQKAQQYLDTRGAKMIVMARFVPAVRTFTPIAAGASRMRYRLFVPYNVAGGILWACGMTLAGYVLGSSVAHIDRYLVPVVAAIILISLIPVALEVLKQRRSRRASRQSTSPGREEHPASL
jgi:membrane-associated protein